jgi:regulator of protease activity HflC (stomatin/prohibitin superfamily)
MTAARIFVFMFALMALIGFGFKSLVEKVPPATIGVKQDLWGASGVASKDYYTGFHLGITGIHKWHFLDRRSHFLTFSADRIRTSRGQDEGALEVRTKDNNPASYDLTVVYRIVPDEAHLIVKQGQQHIYRDRVVATVQSVLREELAELSSEDLYSTEKRLAVAVIALPKLETAMAEYHVKPDSILIRAVRFPLAYERKLQEKQLTYQNRLLAQSQKLVEDQAAITETLAAEIERAEKELRGDWDKLLQTASGENQVRIAEVQAEGNKYDRRIRADADATFEILVADGRLAVDKSEALRNKLRNKALDTLGGRIYLAKQAADNLKFEHVILNSNDPSIPSILDIDELVRLLIGSD